MAATINNSSIMYTVALAGLEDGSGDLKANQGRIQTNSSDRAAKHKDLEEMTAQAEKLKAEAKRLAEEANDAGKFSKAGAVEDAGNANIKVAELNEAMQKVQTEIEEKGKASEEALDRLSAALKALETVMQDYQAAEQGEGQVAEAISQ